MGPGSRTRARSRSSYDRLEGLGLIGNDGADRPPGGPNAWALTEKGREVEDAITQQTSGS